jgi:hypothetical protein
MAIRRATVPHGLPRRRTFALIKDVNCAASRPTPQLWKERRQIDRPLFGSKAPQGEESNWVPTDPNRRFELYAPTKGLFDKAWHCQMPRK